jgi:hypothetical protein
MSGPKEKDAGTGGDFFSRRENPFKEWAATKVKEGLRATCTDSSGLTAGQNEDM